jgi:F0F1-type ATP synthase delta subunit
MEQLEKKASKDSKENSSNWTELVSQLVEKLTGKDMAITYEFDNLVIGGLEVRK